MTAKPTFEQRVERVCDEYRRELRASRTGPLGDAGISDARIETYVGQLRDKLSIGHTS